MKQILDSGVCMCAARWMTHFLSLKRKLNARHTTPKAMPAVAKMKKMTVRERFTDTSFSVGTPSYGIRPPGKVEKVGML